MAQYLPLFRPGDTVTFDATAAVKGGEPLEIGTTARSVAPASAGSTKYVGVAGHDAAVGDKVTVEVGKVIHEFVASAAIALGSKVEAAGNGKVRTATTGHVIGYALSAAAAADATIQVLQA